MNKKITLTFAIIAMIVLIVGCTTDDSLSVNNERIIMLEEDLIEDGQSEESPNKDNLLYLTKDELSAFDGTNGLPAYIAVNGVIYNVTDHPQWNDGMHQGVRAGYDVTTEIYNISPHGDKVLESLEIVGYLIEE